MASHLAACLLLSVLVALAPTSLAARAGASQHIVTEVPVPPNFPETYEIEYSFVLPYVQTVQSGGLRYPVHIWFDGPNKKLRMDVYGGMDTTMLFPNVMYNLYPRINAMHCDTINATAGPTANRLSEEGGFAPPLPSIATWTYAGVARIGNSEVYMWRMSDRQLEKVNSYTFYTAKNGWPMKLEMMGVNLMTGSHFDQYVIEITRYKPGPIADKVFDVPDLCMIVPTAPVPPAGTRLAAQLASLLPSAHVGVGGVSALAALRRGAQQQWQANMHLVESFNALESQQAGYRLALNHFAHMSQQQWQATSLGLGRANRLKGALKGKDEARRSAAYLGMFQRRLADTELPQHVDWRGTGADGPVKDQASCGSCWAFATVGAMQGAWFQATGQQQGFSEQHLVDCSWNYDNNGCGGGEIEPSIQYALEHGGISSEEEYQYLGQNGYCKAEDKGKSGLFSGYMNVEPFNEAALMEAVATHGPVAISMNAGHPSFKFYSEGVYHNDKCRSDPDHLDHAVLVVGYGTDAAGVDYWTIKNSWSTYWGSSGYAKITRKGNDCGITADPVIAVVDQDALMRLKRTA